MHKPPCTSCPSLLSIARSVLDKGYVVLSRAYRSAFPNVTYHTSAAKRRVLRMPLAAVRVGSPESGVSEIYLFEFFQGVNYRQFQCLLNTLHLEKITKSLPMTKQQLQSVLSLAQSDRERELIRYTAVASSGASATKARRHFGLDAMQQRIGKVEQALQELEDIRSAYESIASIQESATLAQFGITLDTESECSNSESEPDDTSDHSDVCISENPMICREDILDILKEAKWNWFQLVSIIEGKGIPVISVESEYCDIVSGLADPALSLLRQSHDAFLEAERTDNVKQNREAAAHNGEIVSESESDNPDDYSDKDRARAVLKKKIQAIRLKCHRDRVKHIAQRRFLQRKVSKKVRGIITEFPDIGKEIERYVEERSVGADAWRRTGVLTFDGNSTVKEKVTYSRIKEHLEKVYQRKFSYGTVVQLCIARNRRRTSAKRYRGVAKVTSRRARKGFTLRYNPDTHWSAALYRNLNALQFQDGRYILNINRDDAAGFRLDTLTTHKLHRSPVVQGREILTTRTDYVNSYPSLLQTTSYNFTSTKTTAEICAGVVKGAGVFPKNAAQHAADLAHLETEPSVNSIFINPLTEQPKAVECIRVDGSTDEGPGHNEVQFWWTLRHMQRPTIVTLVTTRSSGASYLNRVELQNGCLALGHANLFIPSNLNGSCFDSQTGKLDQERLRRNMDQATDIYISRVNGSPCGDTVIHLFKGSDSSENQSLRRDLLTYTKGTKSQKTDLQHRSPERWAFIDKVWSLRNRHMTPGLPSQYIFLLKCCNEPDCPHPLCQEKVEIPLWFPGGPTMDYFPLPVPDMSVEWGSQNCSKCGCDKVCYGHFLSPEETFHSSTEASAMVKPPSQVLKEAFTELNMKVSDDDVKKLSKTTLLPPWEVEMWVDHLKNIQQNRKRGAEKAAATRQRKRGKRYICLCGEEYTDVTDEVQHWIGCDKCNSWFHSHCVGIEQDNIPEVFLCSKCA